MSKFSSILKKLKSIKHIEVILAVLLGLIVLLVYFSSTNQIVKNSESYSSSQNAYIAEVEQKLELLISEIDGAGRVNVMLMVESGTSEESYPKIVSAAVVASGAHQTKVRLDIIKTIEALLNLDAKNIEVLSGKS